MVSIENKYCNAFFYSKKAESNQSYENQMRNVDQWPYKKQEPQAKWDYWYHHHQLAKLR